MQLACFITGCIESLSHLYSGEEAKAIALRLLQEIGGVPNYAYLVDPQAEIKDKVEQFRKSGGISGALAGQKLTDCLRELATGRPLQYVLGYEWFCGYKFRVTEGVLIPRPETEELVRYILKRCEADKAGGWKVLDICTGSGCIAHSLAAGLGERASVWGCDISQEALEVAASQSISSFIPQFFRWDVLNEALPEAVRETGVSKFNRIVSNPPYVCEAERPLMRKNVLDFEPEIALFVPDDDPLLFYRRIARLGKELLAEGGRLYFEINERFGKEVAALLELEGYSGCTVLKDINGKERFTESVFLDFKKKFFTFAGNNSIRNEQF